MKILLVAATEAEITPLFRHLDVSNNKQAFYKLLLPKHSLDILITGVGMVATAYHLGKIQLHDYDLVINTGIAGSYLREIPIASLVQVTEEVFTEIGAETEEDFLLPSDIGFGEFNTAPFQNGSLMNTYIYRSVLLERLPKVKGATANTIHGNSLSIERICKLFQPAIETMEGAAFFYACLKENIPCIQIRSISNYVAPRNNAKWEIKKAIDSLNQFLISFLNE